MPSNTSSKKTAKTVDKLPKGKKGYGQGWKNAAKDSGPIEFETPSGTTCLVRRVGLNGLIKAGILESMDSLTSIVNQEVIPAAEGKPTVDVSAVLSDSKKFQDMIDMIDKITVYAVAEPKLHPVPKTEKLGSDNMPITEGGKPVMVEVESEDRVWTELDSDGDVVDIIYVDQIDLGDKTAIMNFVMGASQDLAAFRP